MTSPVRFVSPTGNALLVSARNDCLIEVEGSGSRRVGWMKFSLGFHIFGALSHVDSPGLKLAPPTVISGGNGIR